MRLAEVLGCLSLGSDLADGFRLEKAMRTSVLAVALAERLGEQSHVRDSSYWAALIRNIGCTAFAAEETRFFSGGDDIALRATLAKVDFGSKRDFARRALPNIAKNAPFIRRVTALARLLADPGAPLRHAHAQCEVGAHLARTLDLGDEVTLALDMREERFDGGGLRKKVGGDALPPVVRVVDVADVAELFHAEGGVDAAVAAVRARRGGHLDPRVVDAFTDDAPRLLAALDAPSIVDVFLDAEGAAPRMLDGAGLRRVASAFAIAIDLKSFFTLGHSTGTAALVERACAELGVDDASRDDAVVAALLHDVGNFAVPGGLFEKPGPLTAWERERVRGHAAHTTMVLRAAPCLARVTDIASASHEHGCGEGYPRATGPASHPIVARVLMAADVYHALREPRAHRDAFDAATAERMMQDMAASGRLCATAVRGVLGAAGHAVARRGPLPRGLSEREIEVLRLVAIGRTNREIGALLAMSPRTAQKHVMNIYDKLGVASRAGAAVFAVEHGLLEPDDARS